MTGRRGFTLLELLVAMVLSAVLITMVFRVMGQTLTNNQSIAGALENVSELATLRRLLGRDLRAIASGKAFVVKPEGFVIKTSHNLLLDGPLPVDVLWRFTDTDAARVETADELRYRRELSLVEFSAPAALSFYEPKQKIWIDWQTWAAPGVDRPRPTALRLILEIRKEKVEIVERIPSASSDASTIATGGSSGSPAATAAPAK